ncbi:glycoside hydrolase family 43 protein [Vibrio viridaestus]|uniref:Alpha-N-arabinofuranosidase n=1 Tax=Vibrio viridaestus TaxID=2487322 RepID=A0A3N9TLD8_9VIBR|nr:family 43 glycosylhydrolase [Vibrio viridaestus]RQW64941.1 alpha-N-arabinofuranosidase [Vibrio viridaestus]
MTNNPIIEQRADPHIYKHTDGFYYFTASVPEYDRIEIRKASSIEELNIAEKVVAWRKPDTGPYSDLIWAPEIHYLFGAWYIYFAAAPCREIKDGLFQHRMYAISTQSDDPTEGQWEFCGQIETDMDTFCLDATTFAHLNKQYYVWAQKDPEVAGNSNLYIAEMLSPTRLKLPGVCISKPEFDWEVKGFMVNEGPYVMNRHGKVWITYSASATDENYCMGMLCADEDDNLLEKGSWSKSPEPVFCTNYDIGVYGPGHSCFTTGCEGEDLLVYHARDYTEIEGDPLWDPNRHTRIKAFEWIDGWPTFGLAI